MEMGARSAQRVRNDAHTLVESQDLRASVLEACVLFEVGRTQFVERF